MAAGFGRGDFLGTALSQEGNKYTLKEMLQKSSGDSWMWILFNSTPHLTEQILKTKRERLTRILKRKF